MENYSASGTGASFSACALILSSPPSHSRSGKRACAVKSISLSLWTHFNEISLPLTPPLIIRLLPPPSCLFNEAYPLTAEGAPDAHGPVGAVAPDRLLAQLAASHDDGYKVTLAFLFRNEGRTNWRRRRRRRAAGVKFRG
jgi:hypothetical protein